MIIIMTTMVVIIILLMIVIIMILLLLVLITIIIIIIILRGNLTGQVLSLLPNGHEFESSQGHWRLTWLLTSRLIRLVEVRAS